jgi:hypothetical protein
MIAVGPIDVQSLLNQQQRNRTISQLTSLWNSEHQADTGFNPYGYQRFIGERFTIVDKGIEGIRPPMEVPFWVNAAQADFMNKMQLYRQLIILKARKMGFSSVALAVACRKFIHGKNEKCVSMSFDQSASEKQLARAKHFIKSYERITGVKLPLKYNSKNEMVMEVHNPDTGESYINTLRVGTAKSTSFGRGDDITFLHLTEVAFCDDVNVLLAAVGEALVHGAHTILETTANGFNSFKTFWDESMLNLRDFACLFYPPEWEYDNAFLAGKQKKLGKLYMQEYPADPETAFITSGDTYFNKDALYFYLQQVKAWEQRNGPLLQKV